MRLTVSLLIDLQLKFAAAGWSWRLDFGAVVGRSAALLPSIRSTDFRLPRPITFLWIRPFTGCKLGDILTVCVLGLLFLGILMVQSAAMNIGMRWLVKGERTETQQKVERVVEAMSAASADKKGPRVWGSSRRRSSRPRRAPGSGTIAAASI